MELSVSTAKTVVFLRIAGNLIIRSPIIHKRKWLLCYNNFIKKFYGGNVMKHIKTINKANLKQTATKGGCGKCQASCQSACKTSCTVANQKCEREA